MVALCQGTPPSYEKRPYPCPKPVGELALHVHPDLVGLEVCQELVIETASAYVRYSGAGIRLEIQARVHPVRNVLIVDWRGDGWGPVTQAGWQPLVWFSLYR